MLLVILVENDLAENSVDDVARDKTETDDLAGDTAIHLDSNNQEKETKKSSNDDINQSPSAAAAATIITSRDVVDQINEVLANVDPVDTTPESLPISRGENLDVHFAEASQKGDNSLLLNFIFICIMHSRSVSIIN